MNALFIQRMSDYQHSEHALTTAQVLINLKITRSNILLTHFHKHLIVPEVAVPTIIKLSLVEGRTARSYLRQYKSLVPTWTLFTSRDAHAIDITNQLLDIGYHHLAYIVSNILLEKECDPSLALLHRAQASNSKPLVYDLMEMFRADTVDMTVVTWLHQKKRPIIKLTGKHIAHFIHNINKHLENSII